MTERVTDRKRNVLADYRYLADGTKIGVADEAGNGYEYLGSLIYRRTPTGLELESTDFSGGRIDRTTAGYAVKYFVRDYLGSVRAIADHRGQRIESMDYLPFGSRWNDPQRLVTGNRYLYNGKEWQSTGRVNLLDYGARMYDPDLGRWFGQDPEYQSANPYAFCFNNPVRFIDPDGRKIKVWAADKGRYYEWKIVDNKWGFYDSQNHLYDGSDPNILNLNVSLIHLITGGFSGFMLVIQIVASETEITFNFLSKKCIRGNKKRKIKQ